MPDYCLTFSARRYNEALNVAVLDDEPVLRNDLPAKVSFPV